MLMNMGSCYFNHLGISCLSHGVIGKIKRTVHVKGLRAAWHLGLLLFLVAALSLWRVALPTQDVKSKPISFQPLSGPKLYCTVTSGTCGGGSRGLLAKSCLTLATPWTVAHQAPLFLRFPRLEYQSGLPFPSPGDPPHPGIEPVSPALQGEFLPLSCQVL